MTALYFIVAVVLAFLLGGFLGSATVRMERVALIDKLIADKQQISDRLYDAQRSAIRAQQVADHAQQQVEKLLQWGETLTPKDRYIASLRARGLLS